MGKGMPGKRSLAMLADDEQIRGLRLPNTLKLPPSHTAATVAHFLKGLYAHTLKEAHPRQLMVLIEKIDEAERQTVESSER
jgi:hypothetical protein